MKRVIIAAALAATFAPALAAQGLFDEALADEVIIHRDAPDVVDVPPRPPRDVVIEHRRPDCSTTTVRRENDLGESSTTTRRDCD